MKDILKLSHFLSLAGVASRRRGSALIKAGHVCVNSQKIRDPAYKVSYKQDKVFVCKKLIKIPSKKWYIAFNKPPKVLTSLSDPKGRPCVSSYFPKVKESLFPVGRLDWDSEGLLLLTNDGDFAHQVLTKKPPKTYMLKLSRSPSSAQLNKLIKGVRTEIGMLKAVYAGFCRHRSQKWVKVILTEGRNRQLHRMFEKLGFHIKVLRRVSIGRLKLRSLKLGECFVLSPQDKQKIFLSPPLPPSVGQTLPRGGRMACSVL